MIKDWSVVGTRSWLALHWKRLLIFGGGGLLAVLLLVQIFYPSGKLLPFTTIENISVSGWAKKDAIWQLDHEYANSKVDVYFGLAKTAYRSPQPKEIGVTVSNDQRVSDISYPWYLRIIPSSLLWGHLVINTDESPSYGRDTNIIAAYITKELGESCSVAAKNASLEVKGGALKIIESADGGTCTLDDVTEKLSAAQFDLTDKMRVTVPVTVVPPAVSDDDARILSDTITVGIDQGVTVKAGNGSVVIPKNDLIGWLDFSVVSDKLEYGFNVDRSASYLNTNVAPKVAVPAGVTKVSTYDFVETSRVVGSNGHALNNVATLAGIKNYINKESSEVVAATSVVAPSVTYTRAYSPSHVGISALMQHYGESHPGTFGVSMIELSGQNRRASYNGHKSFTTASTYKLFVAYSTLKRVEAGVWKWTDQIDSGRDLNTCFDDMIVKSDNACAKALLLKVGFTPITNEARAIGCVGTSFLGSDGIKSTPEDLALLLAMLQSGQILDQQASRDRLINAMKRNIYRQGIPKGANGAVANKVGFMDGLLHDAAIVYGPTGPYVLVIMTDGSSWANIVDLTRQLEALRSQ